jgi:hypothetical protein
MYALLFATFALSVFLFYQLIRLRRISAADYPNAKPDCFQLWYRVHRRFLVILLCAVIGLLFTEFLTLGAFALQDPFALLAALILSFPLFFLPMVWAAILAFKSQRLKRALSSS